MSPAGRSRRDPEEEARWGVRRSLTPLRLALLALAVLAVVVAAWAWIAFGAGDGSGGSDAPPPEGAVESVEPGAGE